MMPTFHFSFRRFDVVGHEVHDFRIPWTYEASRPRQSLTELALVTFWKASYQLDDVVPLFRRWRERSLLNVFHGVWIPDSQLRSRLTAVRDARQYDTEGAGIDVGFAPPPGQRPEGWDALFDWSKVRTKERLHMQMYLKVTSLADLAGKTVLEVGCGQGDGAAFLTYVRSPARFVGVDLHPTQVKLAARRHANMGARLSFLQADAQKLPFRDRVFDVVVNVESAHSYPRFSEFAREVSRVLKADGMFCFSDLRKASRSGESWAAQAAKEFAASGFGVKHHEDITENAWLSLDELRNDMGGHLWVEFESLHGLLRAREIEYHFFALTKQLQQPG